MRVENPSDFRLQPSVFRPVTRIDRRDTYDTLADPDVPDADRPHVLGRKSFGKVAIANADAGAAAYTNVSINEAHRAVQELMLANGLK